MNVIQFNGTPPPAAKPVPAPSAASGGSAASAVPPPKALQVPSAAQAPSAEDVKQAVTKANEFLKSQSAAVEFSVDADSNQVVVKIVDPDTKTLIRQIPSEEMIAISKALDNLTGLLVRQQA